MLVSCHCALNKINSALAPNDLLTVRQLFGYDGTRPVADSGGCGERERVYLPIILIMLSFDVIKDDDDDDEK